MKRFLPAVPPFSLAAVAKSHGWIQLQPFAWVSREAASPTTEGEGGVLTRVERLRGGRVVELCVRQQGDGVLVEAAGDLSALEVHETLDKVTWMLQLDQDLSAFHALAREEPRLMHIRGAAKGRILRSPTLFEDVVKTILTTNVHWSGTIRMVGALVERFGSPLVHDPERRAFPSAEQLAALDEASLRDAGLGYRAAYVLDLARSVISGTHDLETLARADLASDELRRRLLAIRGVGDYAAASLLMLLGHYDFVPVDSWARTMVSREFYGGEPVGHAEVEAAFERWGGWKGLAYWFWDWGGGDGA